MIDHEHVLLIGTGWRGMCDDYASLVTVEADFDFIAATFGPIVFVVEGGAGGADAIIRRVATKRVLPRLTVPARWDKFGKRAGTLRNVEMRDAVDVLAPHVGRVVCLAYPAPESIGTRHMLTLARERGWSVHVHEIEGSTS